MKDIATLLATVLLTSSCAHIDNDTTSCPGSNGGKPQFLDYDEDGISMRARTNVNKKSKFWIMLRPSKAFRDRLVTITGESGKLPNGTSVDSSWLNTSGTWTSEPNRRFVLCVPEVESGTVYKFKIEIEDHAILDPRVHVN